MSMLLSQLVEEEYFIASPLKTTNEFVSYCKTMGIRTSREHLEKLEQLQIFIPIARVRRPKIQRKIEYIEDGLRYKDLGLLQDGENWEGDTKEEYAWFSFKIEHAQKWLDKSILWDPSSRPFEVWTSFYEDHHEVTISYYSIFQCYALQEVAQSMTLPLHAEWWCSYSSDQIDNKIQEFTAWSKSMVDFHKENHEQSKILPNLCQVISNRYYFHTQSDRRRISVSIPSGYYDWSWEEYCQNWDAQFIASKLGFDAESIKNIHRSISSRGSFCDPLEKWYSLVRYVSLDQKKKLKGEALYAQSLYAMEQMLRMFYKDLTGEDLCPPNENISWKEDHLYGEGVSSNELQHLEYLTNQFHLNPRPNLLLVVEGEGEAEQFPRLSNELLGYPFSKLGIEVMSLRGVTGFTGKKGVDKYGALEKLIDFNHNRQTIVYIVLDDEGRVSGIKNKLVGAVSKFNEERHVTKEEYIQLWSKKTVEFENFSHIEIAQAMTEVSDGNITFTETQVQECETKLQQGKEADYLSQLFKKEMGYGLCKTKLLRTLCGYMINNAANEFDQEGVPKRSIVKVLYKVIELASSNPQPTMLDSWKKNQASGYLGSVRSTGKLEK